MGIILKEIEISREDLVKRIIYANQSALAYVSTRKAAEYVYTSFSEPVLFNEHFIGKNEGATPLKQPIYDNMFLKYFRNPGAVLSRSPQENLGLILNSSEVLNKHSVQCFLDGNLSVFDNNKYVTN